MTPLHHSVVSPWGKWSVCIQQVLIESDWRETAATELSIHSEIWLVGKKKNAIEHIKEDVSSIPLTNYPGGIFPLSVVLCDSQLCSLPCPFGAGKDNSVLWLVNCASYGSVSQVVSIDLFLGALQVTEETVKSGLVC